MIRLDNLTFGYNRAATVFDGLSLEIPSNRRVALLGRQDSGKTTLIALLAGLLTPNEGRIERFARVSYPAGYVRGFRMGSSVRQNVEFAAKAYGADPEEVVQFVTAMSGIGADVDRALRDLPLLTLRCVAFALTYALPFDTYLFDNVLGAGTPAFPNAWEELFAARMQTSGAIVATRHARVAEQVCDCAVVLADGKASFYDTIAAGLAVYDAGVKPAARRAPAQVTPAPMAAAPVIPTAE